MLARTEVDRRGDVDSMVTEAQIKTALHDLSVGDAPVAVHSSLSSFGCIAGGAGTIVAALLDVCSTVLMPAYSSIGRTRPPDHDRPRQNGTDYRFYNQLAHAQITPFDPMLFGVDSPINQDMSIIPKTLLAVPGTIRSAHPSVSWAAHGKDAQWYVEPHPPHDPLLPLKKLIAADGYVLLLGVSLAACAALHLAEEYAGRCPFIRWVLYADGSVRRVREYRCSAGFPCLAPLLDGLARRACIGSCEAVVYPAPALVERSAVIMRDTPTITCCRDGLGCERCMDAVKGGPIEDEDQLR